jgi:FAD/FMN-containing dehydrogenase
VALTSDVPSLDPTLDLSLHGFSFRLNVYDQLTETLPDGAIGPRLTTSWEPSEKARTWTLTIRTDAKFHDGSPVPPSLISRLEEAPDVNVWKADAFLRGKMTPQQLLEKLAAIVGAEHLSTDPADCDLATSDIFEWPDRKPALAVVRPADTAEMSKVIAALRKASMPVVARGAGLSYSGGMAVDRDAVVLENTRLKHIEIDQENLAAKVGSGATWASVAAALGASGLASAQPAPISGEYSTVGGLASQGIPAGTEGILGMTVVLPDGSVLHTGASGGRMRPAPDLTGLFLGDCGALGVKTEISLRLKRAPEAEFASFQFNSVTPLLKALSRCIQEGVVSRAFAMDDVKSSQAKSVDRGDALRTGLAVMRKSASLAGVIRNAANLIGFSAFARSEALWSLHLIIESPTRKGARARLHRVQAICSAFGRQTPEVFPRALHARPYSVRGMVGPQGQRWVPVHGIFPISGADDAIAAIRQKLAKHREKMSETGIAVSWLLSSSGPYVLVEPMFYWDDSLDRLHMKYLSPRNRERFGSFEQNIKAREFVRQLRDELRDTMDANGATHCQIGRFYFLDRQQDRVSVALYSQWKQTLDPDDLMNPGVLGLNRFGADQ